MLTLPTALEAAIAEFLDLRELARYSRTSRQNRGFLRAYSTTYCAAGDCRPKRPKKLILTTAEVTAGQFPDAGVIANVVVQIDTYNSAIKEYLVWPIDTLTVVIVDEEVIDSLHFLSTVNARHITFMCDEECNIPKSLQLNPHVQHITYSLTMHLNRYYIDYKNVRTMVANELFPSMLRIKNLRTLWIFVPDSGGSVELYAAEIYTLFACEEIDCAAKIYMYFFKRGGVDISIRAPTMFGGVHIEALDWREYDKKLDEAMRRQC